MKKLLSIVCVVGLITGCTKDKPKLANLGCTDISSAVLMKDTVQDTVQFCQSVFDPNYIFENQYDYINPSANPNNPVEICFARRNNQTNGGEIAVFNLCTGKFAIIASNAFHFTSWSKKGWIAFTGSDSQIWKVKSNGDSLTRLTQFSFACQYPVWNQDGTKLITGFEVAPGSRFIVSEQGQVLDTLNFDGTATDWRGDDILFNTGSADGNYFYMKKINTNSKQITPLITYDFRDNPYGQDPFVTSRWYTDNQIIWNTVWSFRISDVRGNTVQNVKIGTPAKRYTESFIVAGQKIVVSRDNYWIVDHFCNYGVRTNLYIMNLDGSDLHELLIPE